MSKQIPAYLATRVEGEITMDAAIEQVVAGPKETRRKAKQMSVAEAAGKSRSKAERLIGRDYTAPQPHKDGPVFDSSRTGIGQATEYAERQKQAKALGIPVESCIEIVEESEKARAQGVDERQVRRMAKAMVLEAGSTLNDG